MSDDVEEILKRLVETLVEHPDVRAIGLSGGDRPLPAPGEGDLDLFVYCTSIPAQPERYELLRRRQGAIGYIDVGRIPGGHWGQGDTFLMGGVETWLLYFTVQEARAELDAILEGQHPGRQDSYYYPLGRCAMWKSMRALYDPDHMLAEFQRRVIVYPHSLRLAVLQHHLDALGDVEDLERAVGRRDVLFFHFALDLALDHFLQALFALNREYFPSRKRNESYLESFALKPPECTERLRQVVALGGHVETLDEAYEIWSGLVRDLRIWVQD